MIKDRDAPALGKADQTVAVTFARTAQECRPKSRVSVPVNEQTSHPCCEWMTKVP